MGLSGHGTTRYGGGTAAFRPFLAAALHCGKSVLPTADIYSSYPVDRTATDEGGVSGTELSTQVKWRLSTDVGCAFMSIDGLSHVYTVTKDARVKALPDETIGVYLGIGKPALSVQTHCTLTAARGMMRMYAATGELAYFADAQEI